MSLRGGMGRPYPGKAGGGWSGGKSERSSVSLTPPPLGEILATVQLHDLAESNTEPPHVHICNAQYVTSYNWVNEAVGKIIVPGKGPPHIHLRLLNESLPAGEPPAWTPLHKPIQLPADSGIYFRDLNSARHPNYPLEPMIRAILMNKPEFPVETLDIVACGSTLGNLLRFARGKGPAFRMLVEVIGNTVFFRRRETSPKETIQNVIGFGHTFPEAYTTWSESVRKSESHQRIINFDFAKMNCLLRFEADGYLPDLIPESLKNQKNPTPSNLEPEDLLSSFLGTTISTVHSDTTSQTSNALRMFKGGRYIPQSAIFDLKTRSARKAELDTLSEQMGRLWIRQTPNFVLAYHKSGRFDDIRIQDVRDKMMQWEESEQPSLQRFAALLHMVLSFACSAVDGKFELEHDEDEEVLNIRSPGGIVESVLPPDLADSWNAHSGCKMQAPEKK